MKKSFMEPKHKVIKCCLIMSILMSAFNIFCQTKIKGDVIEKETGEPIIGANIALEASGEGAVSEWDGSFEFETNQPLPITLTISYLGYITQSIEVADGKERLKISLEEEAITITQVEVVGQRISDKQKQAPLTVESLDAIAIKQTASTDFYNGLGALKGVDLTTASIGFTIINTRGFNSTSPVRSLQIIDGVDNQSPGLNFSLGNFLGAPELDIQKVDLIAGASSAFYGPNAFNGVISMETKDPFFHKGLSVMGKLGERSLFNGGIRYADALKNKDGNPFFAYKVNLFYMQANDWVADNYDPVSGTLPNQVFEPAINPGGTNKVNVYGDEAYSGNEFTSLNDDRTGLNSFSRTGYREVDMVDYDSKNLKANIAFHFRLNPKATHESPELVIGSNYGNGTTVYQGDNRFSLKNIQFFQHKIEFKKRDKYFLRAYMTNEDAGDSYDPYFTALKMQETAKSNETWSQSYQEWWVKSSLGNVFKEMKELGYPVGIDKREDQIKWQNENIDLMNQWHAEAANYANLKDFEGTRNEQAYFEPGTARFDSLFKVITSRKNNNIENGTKFSDKSALYHIHGEYRFSPGYFNEIVIGSSGRLYRPNSEGTIFSDDSVRISNYEFGVYSGATKKYGNFSLSATLRMDKNQNFNYLFSPAASIVWTPRVNDFFRLSFSSAIRNPTLTDQYLDLNVGPATLLGNLNGFKDLVPLESFQAARKDPSNLIVFEDIDPIRPEKAKTLEIGYRTSLFNNTFIDASYYTNFYNDFIGYKIGLTIPYDTIELFPGGPKTAFPVYSGIKAYRVAANSDQLVVSNGFAIGINHYFRKYYSLSANYSFNQIVTKETDNIVPAFNTPKNKINVGISGRDMPFWKKSLWGFNVNYKWIESFVFEGSPQFTGDIPAYDLLDVQVNFSIPASNLNLKFGASNVLNNKQFQTYGGPRIGRMAHITANYNFVKK